MRQRPLAVFFAAAIALAPLSVAAQTAFTDDGGRTISLPARVDRVFPAGPPASADLLIVAPEKLIGLTHGLTPAEGAFVPAPVARLPAIGRLTGRGETINLESLKSLAPDLIVDVGYVGDNFVGLANRMQQQTGVPYVLIGGALADTPGTLRKLGTVLGTPARAEALARYAEETLNLLKSRIPNQPQQQRPTIYLARGPRGLEAGTGGSINAEVIEAVGARNVATPAAGGRGLVSVSMEQVLGWRPDFIIANDPAFYAAIWQDPAWQQVPAVREKHVYQAPALPFGWADEPPAANRLIGLRWLAKLLYPALFPEDIRAEARRFYALFYQREPSEKQLDALLARAAPPR
jgi:iron complex transport system substrate-binding protein